MQVKRKNSASSSGKTKVEVPSEPTKVEKKSHAQFVLSKRIATKFTTKAGAAMCISEAKDKAFAACGNFVKVFSVRTGI